MLTNPERNKRGCYVMVAIALAVLAIAAWMSFGMQSDPKMSPAAANLSAPGDPTTGS